MGISGFFRFVSERYPLILTDLDNVSIKEFDNLYIDLNGLVHPLTHNGLGFTFYETQTEAMLAVVHYVTQLVYLTKPRKLLYLAVDGVAPRAKLNQQRSRRYKSATRLRGIPAGKFKFDSNCITPGTEFMRRLQQYLQFSIAVLMESDPIWSRLQVIYSGPNVCGEGEHKIAAFIRRLKTLPDARRNLRHCIHGLDADLLMLGLACHESEFFLLRERIDFTNDKTNGVLRSRLLTCEANFQLLDLSILRQYLCISFTRVDSHGDVSSFRFPFDGERVVDDFIILSLLCGNDFLPELDVATIKKDNMGRIHSIYHQYLNDFVPTHHCTEPWLMKNCGQVDWHTLRLFFRMVADAELNLSDARTDVSRRWLRWRYYYLKLGINLFTPAGRTEINEFFIEYLRGIQWVCIYYFRGCPSWSWFFPYHYGPFIVDLLELLPELSGVYLLPEMNEPDLIQQNEMPSELETRLEFRTREPADVVDTTKRWELPEFFLSPDGSQPLEMHEQLMSVLPIDSKSLVPSTYWSLMEEDSPISDFFPDPYIVPVDLPPDMPEWKGKYLLPFIDERRLKDAMKAACLDYPLSESDVQTNVVGTSFVFRTLTSDSSLLPDTPLTSEYQPVIAEMPHGVEAPWLTPLEALPSQCQHVSRAPYALSTEASTFPTVPLKMSDCMVTRNLRSARLAKGVLKHSHPSSFQSVYLVFDPPLTWNPDYFKNFLNALLSFQGGYNKICGIHLANSPVVEIDFPNRTKAQVLSVSTRDKIWHLVDFADSAVGFESAVVFPYDVRNDFQAFVDEENLRYHQGGVEFLGFMDAESRKVPKELGLVDLNEVLLHVLPITEIYRSRSHDRVEFDYATKSRVVRLNAVAFFPIGPPPRRPDLCPLVLSTELDGSFGCVGTLDQNRVATIHFPNQYRLQPVEVEGLRTHWQTVEKAAKALERNVHLVRKMFGNVRIRVGSKRELFDIGLGFTTTVDQETSYATGLAKLAPGGMTLYSNEALNAFRLMDERWTFVLNNMEEGLQKRNGRINADMAFKQDDMEIKPLVEQFISWKMQQPFSRSLFQPATGRGFYESLSVVGVEGLDSIATWGPPAYSTTKTKHYHADNGLRPPTNIPTQRSWMKKPGVRVVYSKFRGILPVGTQGTVIGVYPTLLVEDGHSIDFKLTFGNSALMEVLLDMPSLAGSRLGDRAPPLRGVVAPASHFMAPLRDNRGRGRGDNRGRGRGDNRGRGRGDNRGRGRGDNRGRGRDDSSVRGHGDSRGRGHGEGRNDSGGGSHGRGRGRGHQHNNDTNGNKRADAH